MKSETDIGGSEPASDTHSGSQPGMNERLKARVSQAAAMHAVAPNQVAGLVVADQGVEDLPVQATDQNLAQQLCSALGRTIVRQFRFPPMIRGCVEALLFCSVFIAAGIISLGIGVKAMLAPMVPFVLMMMFCMVASGVYRNEITHSILNLYIHSIYGFFLASIGFVAMTFVMPEQYGQPKFVFFFLFFAFFVMNTLRPIISGTDFMDGGGRRGN